MPWGDARMTAGGVRVRPVGRSISEMWIAKSFCVELGGRRARRVVVERYTLPWSSSSQKSCCTCSV